MCVARLVPRQAQAAHELALDQPERRLVPIPGFPPNLAARPSGCPFAPRCAFAVDACTTAVPPRELVAPGHTAACVESHRIFEGAPA